MTDQPTPQPAPDDRQRRVEEMTALISDAIDNYGRPVIALAERIITLEDRIAALEQNVTNLS